MRVFLLFILLCFVNGCASQPQPNLWVEGCVFGTAETIKSIFQSDIDDGALKGILYQCKAMDDFANGQR